MKSVPLRMLLKKVLVFFLLAPLCGDSYRQAVQGSSPIQSHPSCNSSWVFQTALNPIRCFTIFNTTPDQTGPEQNRPVQTTTSTTMMTMITKKSTIMTTTTTTMTTTTNDHYDNYMMTTSKAWSFVGQSNKHAANSLKVQRASSCQYCPQQLLTFALPNHISPQHQSQRGLIFTFAHIYLQWD